MERVHQTIGNIIRTFIIQHTENEKHWEGILALTMFAIRSTVHTTTQYIPSQLVFGRDAIFNNNQEGNCQLNKQRNQALISKGNQKENRCRLYHMYHNKDKVLFKNTRNTMFYHTHI